jgi:hypothetical protein
MYTLYNRELNRFLKHPKDGIWASDNLEEAQMLLQAAQDYVKAIGVPEIASKLTIMEIGMDQIDGEKLPQLLI